MMITGGDNPPSRLQTGGNQVVQGCSTATTLEAVVGEIGIFVSCSQIQDHHSGAHEEDKSSAIVGNIWHFDSKIGMDGRECFLGIKVESIKPQVDRRTEFRPQQPIKGMNINGSLHMAVQTGVLIEIIAALSAKVRWCSFSILRTQGHAAAAISEAGTSTVFARRARLSQNI